MAEPFTDALKLLGFATPFVYAAATFGFFHYFDERISDEAKTAVSEWLLPKKYDKSAVSAAVLEMFDRIYTTPLLSWRALLRSVLITTGVTATLIYEMYRLTGSFESHNLIWNTPKLEFEVIDLLTKTFHAFVGALWIMLIVNIVTDYMSLFVVRRFLRAGVERPVISITAGPIVGVFFVILIFYVLVMFLLYFWMKMCPFQNDWCGLDIPFPVISFIVAAPIVNLSAFVVHLWLPILALCIAIVRVLNWLQVAVGKTQWLLKGGKEHPLDAIGYVAAALVFAGTGALRLAGLIG